MKQPFYVAEDLVNKITEQKIKDKQSIRLEDWSAEEQDIHQQYEVHMRNLESILAVHQMDIFIEYLEQHHPTLTDKQLMNLWEYFKVIDEANDGGIEHYIYDVPVGKAESAWHVDLTNIPEMTIMNYARGISKVSTETLVTAINCDPAFDIDKGIVGTSKQLVQSSWKWFPTYLQGVAD